MTASHIKHALKFNFPAGTSRGILHTKDSWFLVLQDEQEPALRGIGECSLIPGLSPDPVSEVPGKLDEICSAFKNGDPVETIDLKGFPAIRFALETALRDMETGGEKILFPSDFTAGKKGIPINGLIWMGAREEMLRRVSSKIEAGFNVLKLKVGAIGFDDEVGILEHIRSTFSIHDLEIRLDANGAWEPDEALKKMNILSGYAIHSIEQPVPAGRWEAMADICEKSPIPIALDEELIGIELPAEKRKLIEQVQPAFIILKPSLLGGLNAAGEWITFAEEAGVGWWVTSALESNIGLNAIAQWTYTLDHHMPQGLGTGKLFSNNPDSPLQIRRNMLYHDPDSAWDLTILKK